MCIIELPFFTVYREDKYYLSYTNPYLLFSTFFDNVCDYTLKYVTCSNIPVSMTPKRNICHVSAYFEIKS